MSDPMSFPRLASMSVQVTCGWVRSDEKTSLSRFSPNLGQLELDTAPPRPGPLQMTNLCQIT